LSVNTQDRFVDFVEEKHRGFVFIIVRLASRISGGEERYWISAHVRGFALSRNGYVKYSTVHTVL
jgi:hypothetical protein